MIILIHDMEKAAFSAAFGDYTDGMRIIDKSLRVRPCIGCSNCWIRTPGVCPIRDDLSFIAEDLAMTNRLILVSRCLYGSVSPFVKNVLDRMRGYSTPLLEIHDDQSRYKLRYPGHFALEMHFYGPASEEEQKIAREFAERLGHSMDVSSLKLYFSETPEIAAEVLNENRFD
ncbi:MAG: hypothetical protein Q4B73_03635 [Lachnospiraceae bacterium]|nr:hypothetical protein [Lachnospiraceae bacterium]